MFKKNDDNVCCYLCEKNLNGWQPNDIAWKEHVSHSLQCPLVTLDKHSSRAITFLVNPFWMLNKGNLPNLNPSNMSQAGFFLWPKLDLDSEFAKTLDNFDDTAICFQCGLALDGWDPSDDPLYEHARRRPNCPFIVSNKNGQQSVVHPCAFELLFSMKNVTYASDGSPSFPIITPSCSSSNVESIQTIPIESLRIDDFSTTDSLAASSSSMNRPSTLKTVILNRVDKRKSSMIRMNPTPLRRITRKTILNVALPKLPDKAEANTVFLANKDKTSMDQVVSTNNNTNGTDADSNHTLLQSSINNESFMILPPDKNLLDGFNDILFPSDLDLTLEEAIRAIINRKLTQYDERSQRILSVYDESAKAIV